MWKILISTADYSLYVIEKTEEYKKIERENTEAFSRKAVRQTILDVFGALVVKIIPMPQIMVTSVA